MTYLTALYLIRNCNYGNHFIILPSDGFVVNLSCYQNMFCSQRDKQITENKSIILQCLSWGEAVSPKNDK